jgi:myo-inositol 2-dehydrogenase/D-chiro-inositol 1-dehydrogenase
VIAAATPVHAELIHLEADAGLPTFCEKPIALDLETTDALLSRAGSTAAHRVRQRAERRQPRPFRLA